MRDELVLSFFVLIHKRQQLLTRRPERILKVVHIASVLLLNGIFADMRPHILMNLFPRDLDLLQRIF